MHWVATIDSYPGGNACYVTYNSVLGPLVHSEWHWQCCNDAEMHLLEHNTTQQRVIVERTVIETIKLSINLL
jgi:hypothetical protein